MKRNWEIEWELLIRVGPASVTRVEVLECLDRYMARRITEQELEIRDASMTVHVFFQ